MKRFVASEMWEKRWFREFTPVQKCFWMYLFTQCDCAGVWNEDFELASFAVGGSITEQDMAIYGDRVKKLPDGKWWLVTFIDFQYGILKESKVHVAVRKRLKHHGLCEEDVEAWQTNC